MTYNPQVNDYVIWERNGLKDEGWIYFITEPTEQKKGFPSSSQYLTIEVGVKKKPECQYDKRNHHKYIHILLCCYENQMLNHIYSAEKLPLSGDFESGIINAFIT